MDDIRNDKGGGARKAFLIAIAGFALLSAGDVVTKLTTAYWPGSALAALRYALGAAGLALVLWMREGRAGFAMPQPWIQVGRGLAVALSTLCFFLSLQFLPLATATAIGFTTPFLTAFLSAVFLGERLSSRQLFTALVAFVGVLLVLRPDFAAAGLFVLLPLGAAFGMACLMILNRKVALGASALAMQFLVAAWGALFMIAAAIVLDLVGPPEFAVGPLDVRACLGAAVVAITATAAHWLLYLATLHASAATVAPAIYVQVPMAVGLGWVIFGAVPDALAFAGMALIVAAGLAFFRGGRFRR